MSHQQRDDELLVPVTKVRDQREHGLSIVLQGRKVRR